MKTIRIWIYKGLISLAHWVRPRTTISPNTYTAAGRLMYRIRHFTVPQQWKVLRRAADHNFKIVMHPDVMKWSRDNAAWLAAHTR